MIRCLYVWGLLVKLTTIATKSQSDYEKKCPYTFEKVSIGDAIVELQVTFGVLDPPFLLLHWNKLLHLDKVQDDW